MQLYFKPSLKPTPSKSVFNPINIPKTPMQTKTFHIRKNKLLSNFLLLSIPKRIIFPSKKLTRNNTSLPTLFSRRKSSISTLINSQSLNMTHSKSENKLTLAINKPKRIYFSKNDSIALEKAKMFMREIEKKEKSITSSQNVNVPHKLLLKCLKNKEGGDKFIRQLNPIEENSNKKMKKLYLKGIGNGFMKDKTKFGRGKKCILGLNKVSVIKKEGVCFKEMVKEGIKENKRFKAKDDWFFGYKNKEFKEKVKSFKELKCVCSHKKVTKSNFMNRMIRFDSFNKTMGILGKVHMDVAFSQRKFITKKVGFHWVDPFCLKKKEDEEEDFDDDNDNWFD